MVDDLDVETGEMCDGLHGFAFIVMGGMLEPGQRNSPSNASSKKANLTRYAVGRSRLHLGRSHLVLPVGNKRFGHRSFKVPRPLTLAERPGTAGSCADARGLVVLLLVAALLRIAPAAYRH